MAYETSYYQVRKRLPVPTAVNRIFELIEIQFSEARTYEGLETMSSLLSLVVNLLSSDDHNIAYLLELGIVDEILRICDWNSPGNPMSTDEVEYKILMCFNNLVCSVAFDFGKDLVERNN